MESGGIIRGIEGMRSLHILILTVVLGLVLQGCFIFTGLALINTLRDINTTLNLVYTSIHTIRAILDEGKDIKRAAEEGTLVATLADRIPTLVRGMVEESVRQRIGILSLDLKGAALDLTAKSLAEDLTGARKACDNMTKIYDEFVALTDELSEIG